MATDNFKTMDDEILIDDTNDVGSGSQPAGEQGTTVTPLIYIHQGKLCSGGTMPGSQTAPTPSTIISPIIPNQNKMYVQGMAQVTTSAPNQKPHIVIHRPITTLSNPVANQAQKHIVLRKSSNASSTQILPLQTSQTPQTNPQSGKHTFAYLGTLIKPNKTRDSVVIPAGALSTSQTTKPKIVITPVISQISPVSNSGATATVVQAQAQKHTANLLLPVSIPQHGGTAKQGMFNLKINNGQISAEGKGTITVLREAKSCGSSIHPPPLHPLTKIGRLNPVKGNTSSDGIKITENADSAVITPIPNVEEEAPPEKRKKTISNILRGSSEKRSKKQIFPKSTQGNTCDFARKPNSPDLDHERGKKRPNDDDITLIKVVPSEDKRLKQDAAIDDDIKIEIIKAVNSKENETVNDSYGERKTGNHAADVTEAINNSHQNDPNFDPTKVLDWQDGVGSLPGSTLKFRLNEFGMMEMVEEDDNKQTKNKNNRDKENVCLSQNSSNSSPSALSSDKKEEKKTRTVAADTIYCCENCGCHGLAAEFESPISCGPSCTEMIEVKKVAMMRKEKELKDLRAKRKLKRLLQEQQNQNNQHNQTQQKQQEQSQSQSQSQSLSQSQSHSEAQSQTQTQTQPKPQTQAQPKPQTHAQPKPQTHAQPKSQTHAQPKPQTHAQPKPQTHAQPKSQTHAQPKPQGQGQPKPQTQAQPKPHIPIQPRPPIPIQPRPQIHIQPKPQLQVQPQTHSQERQQQRQREQVLEIDQDDRSKDRSESDEEVKYASPTFVEESQDEHESKYPWQTGKLGFSWAKYLEHTKAKAAPVKLFKDAFPYSKNHFKIGMKLEGIDPEHPSRYCVLTVVEVVGYRIRLHFDGYPENYDFWVNGDSMDIFPVGWAEKNNHKLDPPKGYVASNFSWTAYLKTCKAPAAPKTIFANKNTLFPTGFRQGMKLEAVDRKHSSLVCVASIAELMDSRILVHFDSWDEVYDYWADASSPYIHPVGWCHHNGHSLTPPNNYKDPKSFTWDTYLRETRSVAAPSRAFKQRPPCGFKRGMKLEVVDKRVPQLIRVATVEDVKDHVLKIRFDGWPEHHAYWVDDDSPDIHPMGWCLKTGHPLEPPLTPENLNDRTECGMFGCRGIGHVKGPKFATHNSASGCPYSAQNLNRIRPIPDRLNVKQESCDFEEDVHERSKSDKYDRMKMERGERSGDKYSYKDEVMERMVKNENSDSYDLKYERTEYTERPVKYRFRYQQSDGQTDDDEVSKKRKKRRQVSEEASLSPSAYFGDNSTSLPYAANIPDKQLRTEIYHSVYNPGYNPLPDAPHIWAKHSNALNRVVAKQNTDPRRWSNEEVIKFIHSVPNCREIGSIFRKNSIDGEAFLMLTQEDLVSLLGLRLGPAIKLYNSIVLLRRRAA